jgi:hypothetical protein
MPGGPSAYSRAVAASSSLTALAEEGTVPQASFPGCSLADFHSTPGSPFRARPGAGISAPTASPGQTSGRGAQRAPSRASASDSPTARSVWVERFPLIASCSTNLAIVSSSGVSMRNTTSHSGFTWRDPQSRQCPVSRADSEVDGVEEGAGRSKPGRLVRGERLRPQVPLSSCASLHVGARRCTRTCYRVRKSETGSHAK